MQGGEGAVYPGPSPRVRTCLQMLRIRFKHSWGTAEKLYKSEAIDSFGNKYLLGVYETVKEAEKAFDEWNKEHLGAEPFSKCACGGITARQKWN